MSAPFSTDFSAPRFLERAKTITVDMPLYQDGSSPVSVASGVYTLTDGNGTTQFTGATTQVSGTATRQILASNIPATLTLSDQWLETWVLTMTTGGSVETVRRDVYLCLRTLYPPVNERMLARRISDLDSFKRNDGDNFQGYIDEAWSDIESRLIQAGKRPFLITNAWALKAVHIERTIQLIFEDVSTYMGESGRYQTRGNDAKEAYDLAWDTLQLEYDDSQTGQRGQTTTASGPAVIYINRPPHMFRSVGFFGD